MKLAKARIVIRTKTVDLQMNASSIESGGAGPGGAGGALSTAHDVIIF